MYIHVQYSGTHFTPPPSLPLSPSISLPFSLPLLLFLPLSLPQYLSNADERLQWQANALPTDDLCTENAIMIRRFNRYPLVIDPSGQATEFIMNEYRDRKITRTRLEQFALCKISVFSGQLYTKLVGGFLCV